MSKTKRPVAGKENMMIFVRGHALERPKSRFVQGYYEINPDTANKFFPPVTRREAQALAKREEKAALFFDTEDDAIAFISVHARRTVRIAKQSPQDLGEIEMSKITRKGSVVAKGNKTDAEASRFVVAEINGDIYYLNTSICDWCSIPSEWISNVVWE